MNFFGFFSIYLHAYNTQTYFFGGKLSKNKFRHYWYAKNHKKSQKNRFFRFWAPKKQSIKPAQGGFGQVFN